MASADKATAEKAIALSARLFLSKFLNAERPHWHPAVTEDRKGTKHPKEDTNQGMQEVVIARVIANWLQRNTRDDSQDGAKREVVRERQEKEE